MIKIIEVRPLFRYTGSETGWKHQPAWRLSLYINRSPISAQVHAVTGEVLEVK